MNLKTYTFFKDGSNKDIPIILLHGTGGYEGDLSSIANKISPNSPQISIRGRYLEDGYTRYFIHNNDKSINKNILMTESKWLMNQINQELNKHHLKRNNLTIIGYSNGANIAINSWLLSINPAITGILFHPMFIKEYFKGLSDKKINLWCSFGTNDKLISAENFQKLNSLLKNKFSVQIFQNIQSHKISEAEIRDAKLFLKSIYKTNQKS